MRFAFRQTIKPQGRWSCRSPGGSGSHQLTANAIVTALKHVDVPVHIRLSCQCLTTVCNSEACEACTLNINMMHLTASILSQYRYNSSMYHNLQFQTTTARRLCCQQNTRYKTHGLPANSSPIGVLLDGATKQLNCIPAVALSLVVYFHLQSNPS